MTHDENIKNLRFALGVAGFNIPERHLDTMASLYELVKRKGGATNLMDISKILSEVEERFKDHEK